MKCLILQNPNLASMFPDINSLNVFEKGHGHGDVTLAYSCKKVKAMDFKFGRHVPRHSLDITS